MRAPRIRGNQLRLSLLLLALLPIGMSRGSSQTSLTLASLTVPEKSLPTGCRLKPPDVPQTTRVLRGGQTIVVGDRSTAYPFPSNPWIGVNQQLIIELRKRIDGSLRIADAPPPNAAEVAALEHRWIADVVEGYGAVYTETVLAEGGLVEPSAVIEVSAIKFNDARLATTTPTPANASRGVSDRLVIGSVVVRVVAGSKTDCFSAVSAYLRSLK
jgi:hypothetical protein